jgi:O-antigen/teichoic acid export membrane protein
MSARRAAIGDRGWHDERLLLQGSIRVSPVESSEPSLLARRRGAGRSGGLRVQLLHGAVASLGIRLAATGLTFAMSVVLARALGPHGYGVYSYVLALTTVLAIPAQFGLPPLIVRETARAAVGAEWGLMRGLWRFATLTALLLSLALAMLAGLSAIVLGGRLPATEIATYAWSLALIPLVALGNLRAAALRGLQRVVQGQLPDQIIRPAALVVAVLTALALHDRLGPDEAMELYVAAALLAFTVGAVLLRRARPPELATGPIPVYRVRPWLAAILPLALIGGLQLVNRQTDTVMLGMFTTADQVGIYRVASQGALLVAFGLSAINMVVAPIFAKLYAEGDMARLQRVVTASSRAVLLFALPPVIALVFWGGPILRLVFGKGYTSGDTAMAILCVGQLVNATFGSVVTLLNMSGHERMTLKGVAVAAVGNIVGNAILIPLWGIAGAAVATSVTLGLWNILLWRGVRHRLGIDSTAFSLGLPTRWR